MKCTSCGCKNLKEIKIIDNQIVATEGYVAQTVKSYACKNCGHVELYASKAQAIQKEYRGSKLGG